MIEYFNTNHLLGVCCFTVIVGVVFVVVGVVVVVVVVGVDVDDVVVVCAVCVVKRCPLVCTKQHGLQYCCWEEVRK